MDRLLETLSKLATDSGLMAAMMAAAAIAIFGYYTAVNDRPADQPSGTTVGETNEHLSAPEEWDPYEADYRLKRSFFDSQAEYDEYIEDIKKGHEKNRKAAERRRKASEQSFKNMAWIKNPRDQAPEASTGYRHDAASSRGRSIYEPLARNDAWMQQHEKDEKQRKEQHKKWMELADEHFQKNMERLRKAMEQHNEQHDRFMEQHRKNRELFKNDLEQAKRDREQFEKDEEQFKKDEEQRSKQRAEQRNQWMEQKKLLKEQHEKLVEQLKKKYEQVKMDGAQTTTGSA